MRQRAENASALRGNEARNRFVRDQLTGTLVLMLRDRPLDEITISALCDRAQVGRASFYRNFASKEEVLRVCARELLDSWAQTCLADGSMPLDRQVGALFAHLARHREFYGLLYERGLAHLLKDAIVDLIAPQPIGPAAQAYATAFVAYSLYGWVETWLARGMQETPEELAALFATQG